MKNLRIGLIAAFILISMSATKATNPISVQAHYIAKDITQEKANKSFFKKVKIWVQKKLIPDFEIDGAKTFAKIALISGILSILSWFLVAVTQGWILVFIVAFALAGDIFAGITLWNTRENKEEYKSARRMAWWGLILSLLTGLAPLALFIIVLASL